MDHNVLFVTADQWRGDWLSQPFAPTPRIDALAAESVLFTQHHAQMTPCGPSRASLHTGLYGFNHRSVHNGTPLDARHTTIALEARRRGYDPVLFGYTDTTVDPRSVPADDPRLRRSNGIDPYENVAPGYRAVCHLPEAAGPWLAHLRARGYGEVDLAWAYGGPLGAPAPYRAEDSETAFLADRALEHLAAASEPWFVHISFIKPHPPFVAAEPWHGLVSTQAVPAPVRQPTVGAEGALHPWLADWLTRPFGNWFDSRFGDPRGLDEDRVRTMRAVYAGLIAEVDHHVGRLIDHLRRTGALERTLVIVTADHGEMLGDHWMIGKSGFFREAFHVPLLIRDPRPGAVRGRRVAAFTEHVDLMPTILAAIGAEVPLQADGCDLGPWLAGETPAGWRDATHWEHDVVDLESGAHERLGLGPDEGGVAVRFDGRHAYVHFTALPPLLFDHLGDPGWTRCQLAQAPQRGLELAQGMLGWRMRHAERRLSRCLVTPAGIVGRYG